MVLRACLAQALELLDAINVCKLAGGPEKILFSGGARSVVEAEGDSVTDHDAE